MIARRVRRRDAELVGRAGRIAGHDVAFVAAVALLRANGDGLLAVTMLEDPRLRPPGDELDCAAVAAQAIREALLMMIAANP